MRLRILTDFRLMRTFLLGLSVLAVVMACSGSSGPKTRPEASATRDQYLILADEIEKSARDNLYDAVRQLRPGWFSRRTRNRSGDESIIVYLDDRQYGSVGSLRQIPVRSVHSVRYLSPTEAQVRYGQMNVGRPAILIEMAR